MNFISLLIVICFLVDNVYSKKSQMLKAKDITEDRETLQEIQNSHDELDSGFPRFEKITLGYVTPWNNHGYDVAKWAAQKFTHISPVWFQLTPAKINGGDIGCEIRGGHDIDKGWMDDIRNNNSEVKFYPRAIIEVGNADVFKHFLLTQIDQVRCADSLAAFLKKNNFDGVVLETWLQILVATQGTGLEPMIEMIEMFSKRLRRLDLGIILPMTPPIMSSERNLPPMLPQKLVPRVVAAVDYINLMTYDFTGEDYQGLAPIPWIHDNIHYFLESAPGSEEKILMGLNFYGNCKGDKNGAILAHEFLDLLENDAESIIFWDSISQENFIEWGQTVCYFPTRRSIDARMDLVDGENLAGIAIWDLGQGLDHFTASL